MTEDSADPISSPRWVEAMLSPAAHGVWRSLVARFVRDEEVVGSNPATPTTRTSASLLVRRPRRKGSKGRRPKHPDDEKTHELAHEVFEEEGVRGRQAEYPDDEKACEFARGPSAVPGPKRPVETSSAPPESIRPTAQCPQR